MYFCRFPTPYDRNYETEAGEDTWNTEKKFKIIARKRNYTIQLSTSATC